MTQKNYTQLKKDIPNRRITLTRSFNAPPEEVWRAWTDPEYLDIWWAPEPWKAETKSMDFKEGGQWLYAMVGLDKSKQWSRVDFTSIIPLRSFSSIDIFCDEHGNPNKDMPAMKWRNDFHPTATGTKVTMDISFINAGDLEKLVEMGFEAGITTTLDSLEHYLSIQFKVPKEVKTNAARVTTYLNFPGKTEEAFNFYKKVFNGGFTGVGLRRFGDIVMPAEMPPLDEETKKLIMHAELTIMAGHVLMATDSPESMGFTMELGNNMHINVEPETKEETKRLFDELSNGGKITMPLEDMFWGAYFGAFTDKYGVNWMLNYQVRG